MIDDRCAYINYTPDSYQPILFPQRILTERKPFEWIENWLRTTHLPHQSNGNRTGAVLKKCVKYKTNK